MKEQIDITIKPTMGCNMKCKHCFNGDYFKHTNILDVNVALELVEKACKEYKNVKIIFHGGEPSLAGVDFYKKFFYSLHLYKDKYETEFSTIFTTNGLLLSEEFIEILNENDTLINVSFDGPYNNILRQQTEKVQDIIFSIRDKCRNIRCFCTLSKESVPHLREIYDWFNNNKLNFKTLPVEKRGYAKLNNSIIMNPVDLVKQFEQVYRYWTTDKHFHVRYFTFEEFANLRRTTQYKKFWFGNKIALNPDGRLYVYGRPNDVNYSIGTPYNIENISDCFESTRYTQYLSVLENLRNSRCKKCDSKDVCGGVNINIAHLYVDDLDLIDYSCMQSNLIFQTILKVNDGIIQDFQNGKSEKYNNYIQKTFSSFCNTSINDMETHSSNIIKL